MKNYKKLQDVIWELTIEAYKAYTKSDYLIGVEKYPNDEDENIYAIFTGTIDNQNIVKSDMTIEEIKNYFTCEAMEDLNCLYPLQIKNGRMYQMTQNAYLDYNSKLNRMVYTAKAITFDGNEYMLVWEITDSETEDECNACNWDEFEVIEL